MNLSEKNIEALREIISGESQRVVILSHTNPDGDALGSSIAWKMALRRLGHQVEAIVPNAYPYYLDWIPELKDVIIYRNDAERAEGVIGKADVIFCLDFHTRSRLDSLGDVVAANTSAKRVLVDHHLYPSDGFDVMFSHPVASRTSYLVY